jgi:hypothetical protein
MLSAILIISLSRANSKILLYKPLPIYPVRGGRVPCMYIMECIYYDGLYYCILAGRVLAWLKIVPLPGFTYLILLLRHLLFSEPDMPFQTKTGAPSLLATTAPRA